MGVVETIALAMGIGWASGINLYAAICMLGILGSTGHLELPPDWIGGAASERQEGKSVPTALPLRLAWRP